MYHCFSCDARRETVRDPWNCHQCGSDFVDKVDEPMPQEPQGSLQSSSSPFGKSGQPSHPQTQFNQHQSSQPSMRAGAPLAQTFQRTTSAFGPPPSAGGIGGIRRVARRSGASTYMAAGAQRRGMQMARPAIPLAPQPQASSPFGVARPSSQTQSLTSLFDNLPSMQQRPTPQPMNRGRPQMFVTPDGRIVNQPVMPGVASQEEIQRRTQALQIKKLTAEQKEDPCSICLDDHEEEAAFLPKCGHFFHQTCMTKWLEQKNSCPLCQEPVA